MSEVNCATHTRRLLHNVRTHRGHMFSRAALHQNAEYAVSSFVSLTKFVVCVHLFNEYVAELTMTCGPSMLPTLSASGDTLLVDRRANIPNWAQRALGQDFSPRVGDVVVARSPKNPQETVCKRVAALPGQRARVGGDVVPKGKVWLEGDNKLNSTDSRDYGPVPLGLIEGRVICRVWPPSKAGLLPALKEPPTPTATVHTVNPSVEVQTMSSSPEAPEAQVVAQMNSKELIEQLRNLEETAKAAESTSSAVRTHDA